MGTRITRPSEGVICEAIETGGQSTRAFSLIEKVLAEAKIEREQIDVIAIGLGPGSYTGVRAAISLAQGWQLASRSGMKLIGISSAECLAAQAQAEGLSGRVSVVIDAQRGEFYLADYELGPDGGRETGPLRLVTLAAARERERAGGVLIGPEVTKWFPTGRTIFPRAATLGKLAMGRNNFVAGEKLEPVYLRETNFVKAPAPRQIPS
jgi:tRNA threonylcarbamoyladenosine biosynthesis protein TsaB